MKAKEILTCSALLGALLCTTSCRSTLYTAARDGDVQTVKAELADGADPSGKASAANLLWQIPTGIITIPLDFVRLFLPGTPGWYKTGKTTERGTPEMKFDWKTLLTRKVYNYRKATAMDVATDQNHAEVITELILAGSEATGWAKNLALAAAARKGDADTLRRLMEKGCAEKADWNNEGDYKPLMLAIGGGHEECARILLEHGAKFESTVTINNQEITCYDYAASKGQLELYKKLGGPEAFSPSTLSGRRITFTHRQHVPIWTIAEYAKNNSYTTPTFGSDNSCKDNYPDIPNSFVYKKVGAKTATISIEGYEVMATYQMTFTTPTSGTATCTGGDDGGGFSDKNIRFTIK